MDSKLSSVIEKVQKLLALSKSNNANEAAVAAAAANKLIDQYRLSEADISSEQEVNDPIEVDSSFIYETGRVTAWKQKLIHVLCEHYGVAHFNDVCFPEGRKISRFRLVGKQSDIHIVRYMFAWLTVECQRLSDMNTKGLGRVFAASYCEGFVSGISSQLEKSRQEMKETATSNALIKLDARLDEAKDFMYDRFDLKTVKVTSQAQKDALAFGAGKIQGNNIHLGSSLGSSKPVRMLGE